MTMKKCITVTVAIMIIVAFSSVTNALENLYSKNSPEKLPEVKSMFFCGYCHILTYPRVIKKAHGSWKTGKHKEVPCADCHYPPGTIEIGIPEHERIPKDKDAELEKKTDLEFMKTELEVLSRLVTILNMEEMTVVRRSKIDDRSGTGSKCHPQTGEGKKSEYWTKKIKYAEYERKDKSKGIVLFHHDKHYDREKWVKGDVLHCNTCHYRLTEKKHFEVARENCFLCHFGNNKFNDGLSKCSHCHEIPTKPLQKQKSEEKKKEDEKPITHESLEEAKVPCWSCHQEIINGKGDVTKKKCLDCHDYEEQIMKKAEDQELMHKEHVASQNARCFECHVPIEHKKVADYFKPVIENCEGCHENSHIYQKKLLTGDIVKEMATTPGLMFDAKTNCLGCHTKFEHDDKGQKIKRASAKACVACHTKRHESMLKEWKDKIKEEIEAIEEVKKEAQDAIEKAKGKIPDKKLQDVTATFNKGQKTLNIVKYGNGVHNKKYSIMLIDIAFELFEDVNDILEVDSE
jgi:gas vesicle protein